jgi:metal-sulfur cluster biosynthetic enzyme
LLTEADLLNALRDCFEPEVKVNLVDLGCIYAVEIGPDLDSTPKWPRHWVRVRMTLPTPDAPANPLVLDQVNNRLASIPAVSRAQVELVWEPRWTPQRITPAGRAQLGL